MAEAVARIRGLTVAGPAGIDVLQGLDLDLAPGEVVGLMGPSGSGKTTVALSLVGHVRAGLHRVAGSVEVAGVDPFGEPALVRRRLVSFLGQDPAAELNPLLSVAAHLRERLADAGVRGSAAGARLRQVLGELGLPVDADFLRRRPAQISGGQARRVALAVAVVADPRVLVLDEPTASPDPASAEAVLVLLTRVSPDTAVLVVSHDREFVTAACDRVLHLELGVLVTGAPPVPAPLVRATRDSAATLAARGLQAAHGARPVLAPTDLDLEAGRTVAVVGPSGVGKSTLARCLVGLHAPTAGTLTLDGHDLAPAAGRRTAAQRHALQLVPQNSAGALNPRERALDAVARAARSVGLDRPAAATRAAEVLAGVRLAPALFDRLPAQLSGGERQRVNLARALVCEPRVLICDEITSALDDDVAGAVLALVDRQRVERGLAVLLITHDRDEVARWADHVVTLRQP